MWQTPNQRLRAIINAKKREREKRRRVFHIQRISVNLVLDAGKSSPEVLPAIPVRIVLNDISSKGVGIFSATPLNQGQIVTFNITEPVQVTIRSRVVWCQDYRANSHILFRDPFTFRMGLEFLHTGTDSQSKLKQTLDEMFRKYLFNVKPSQVA